MPKTACLPRATPVQGLGHPLCRAKFPLHRALSSKLTQQKIPTTDSSLTIESFWLNHATIWIPLCRADLPLHRALKSPCTGLICPCAGLGAFPCTGLNDPCAGPLAQNWIWHWIWVVSWLELDPLCDLFVFCSVYAQFSPISSPFLHISHKVVPGDKHSQLRHILQ